MNTFTEDSISHANPHYTYYLLTKIPRIESLTDPTVLVNQGILDQYNKSDHVHLIYDLSTESITFTDYGSKILKQFHEILIKQRIENKRVFLLCANANAAQHYEAWANANNFSHFKINMIGYHFYLYEYYNETQKCDWLKSNRFALKNSSSKTVTDGLKRNKHFLCLNLRPRRHRTAILLHLLDRGFLDKGHTTYFGDEFADHDSVDKLSDFIQFVDQFKDKERLLAQLDNLKKITPLLLDKNAEKMRDDLWNRKPGQVEFLIPEGNQLSSNGIDTYFEIVTETWFSDQTNLYITEKTIRPILRLQPFIHVGSPFLLDYLKKIGFQTFAPYIDESYDKEADPVKRMELIFNEIDRLCNMSIDQIHQLYCDLWPRLLHNYEHFKNQIPNIAEEEINDEILDKFDIQFLT